MPAQRRRYTKRQKTAAVVTAELSSTLAAAEAHGIPNSTLRYWLDDPRFANLRAKTREETASGFSVLVHMAQERLRELIPTMEAKDLITLTGVATDKGQLLAGHATQRTETADVTAKLTDHESAALEAAVEELLESAK